MKKILLTLTTFVFTLLTTMSTTMALSSHSVIDESKDIPYWLIGLIVLSIVWMAFLYFQEHTHN